MTKQVMKIFAKAHLIGQLAKWKQFKEDYKNGVDLLVTEDEIDEAIEFYSKHLADLEKDN